MKKYNISLIFLFIIFLFSCQKKEQININEANNIFFEREEFPNEQTLVKENEFQNNQIINPLLRLFDEDPEWFTKHVWYLDGGHIDFSPIVTFQKLEKSDISILYQRRLRDEHFYLLYQPEGDINKLIHFNNTILNNYDLVFRNDYSFMGLYKNGKFNGGGNRVGEIENLDYPIVGIWGQLPSLSEYRIVDYTDCKYFMEISEREIGLGAPGTNLRVGTYLLKQTGVKTFETISSFPDGLLNLDIQNEKIIMVTKMFSLSDDERDFYGYYTIFRDD